MLSQSPRTAALLHLLCIAVPGTDGFSYCIHPLFFPGTCTFQPRRTSGIFRFFLLAVLRYASEIGSRRICHLSTSHLSRHRTYCRRFSPSSRVFCNTDGVCCGNKLCPHILRFFFPEVLRYVPSCLSVLPVGARIFDVLCQFWQRSQDHPRACRCTPTSASQGIQVFLSCRISLFFPDPPCSGGHFLFPSAPMYQLFLPISNSRIHHLSPLSAVSTALFLENNSKIPFP